MEVNASVEDSFPRRNYAVQGSDQRQGDPPGLLPNCPHPPHIHVCSLPAASGHNTHAPGCGIRREPHGGALKELASSRGGGAWSEDSQLLCCVGHVHHLLSPEPPPLLTHHTQSLGLGSGLGGVSTNHQCLEGRGLLGGLCFPILYRSSPGPRPCLLGPTSQGLGVLFLNSPGAGSCPQLPISGTK